MCFDHRKERHELLEELIVEDKNFTAPHFTQVIKELTLRLLLLHLMGLNL
jgi:hypothetical protein